MPIRFACPHCRQKLSISSRKAGQTADCLRCKKSVTIPLPAEPAAVLSASVNDLEQRPPVAPRAEPTAIAVEFDGAPGASHQRGEDLELVYDDGSGVPKDSPSPEPPDLIAVPRSVLYLQGGLLAVVACTSFAIGILAGGIFSEGSPSREPLACTLEGSIQYADGNQTLPDSGAVIAIIPDTKLRPDEKAPVLGLRPEDTWPEPAHRGLSILRELGGAYIRSDEQGRFQVKVPDRGRYLVLVISQNRQLKSLDEISTEDILRLGPYFDNAADLLGRQQYQLTREVIRGDRRLDVVFR